MISLKRIISMVLSLLMILSVMTVSVSAADEITVSVGKVSGVVGDEVIVPVTVSEGSELVSGAFCIEYDSSVLAYAGYEDGDIEVLSQAYAQEVVVGEDAVGIIFSTENSTIAVSEAGTVLNLKFTILECEPCTSALTVNLVRPDEVTVEGGIANAEGIIDAIYVDGSVQVIELGTNNTKLSYSISYDGVTYTTPAEAELDSNFNIFKTVECEIDRNNDFVYIKYDIQSDGHKAPIVEVRNPYGFWTVSLDEEGVVKIPMYIIGSSAASSTNINVAFTVDCGTETDIDDINMSFAIKSVPVEGTAPFVSSYLESEYDTFVKANEGSVNYSEVYDVDVYYTEDCVGGIYKTKVWVSDSAPADYTYDFQSCELLNDEINGKLENTDVTFYVSPKNASVVLAGKTVVAENGIAVFENIAIGQKNYKVTADGYKTAEGTVNVSVGMLPVDVTLEFNPYSKVVFNVTPDEAEVEFNGEIGLVIDGTTEFYDVPFGTYEYVVTYPGYETFNGTLVVDSSKETVNVSLEEIVTSTDVVFNVVPGNAKVKLDTTTKTAVDGVVTFTDVEFGSYDYVVSADGYVSKSGTVVVEKDMDEISVSLEKAITSTNVTFNVTPADAAVTLNGVTVNAVDGVAIFEDVEFGTYTYTVAKEGYVTATADVTVALDMAAVTVALKEVPAEPEDAPVPELVGLRTYSVTYDEASQTVYAVALEKTSNAGVALVIDGATSLNDYTTDAGNGIKATNSGGYRYFLAYQTNGKAQTFNIYYGDYTYTVNFKFVSELEVMPVTDVLTLRTESVAYDSAKKTITVVVDRFKFNVSASTYAVGVIAKDGETAEITYNRDNGTADAVRTNKKTTTDRYTSVMTGHNAEADGVGAPYGRKPLFLLGRPNGTRVYLDLTITKADGTTELYTILVRQDDLAYEGDVDISEFLPLRANAESFVLDNENKTIYYETSTAYTSAGFAVAVDNGLNYKTRPRRLITAGSGFGLAHGPTSTTAEQNKFDRYVVARLSKGTEQTYTVKVHGGADGLEYSTFTVTVKFNRVYNGDIEFAEILTNYADSCEFDTETNTINVYYSGDKAAIAPVLISGCKVTLSGGSATYIDGNKGIAVNVANGETQTATITLKVGNDTTVYTVNFIHQ